MADPQKKPLKRLPSLLRKHKFMPLDSEPTLGEILRRLEELTIEVKSIPLRIDETYVRRDVYRSDHDRISDAMSHLIDRLDKIESRSEWTVRVVGTLIITAVVGAAIYIGQIPL